VFEVKIEIEIEIEIEFEFHIVIVCDYHFEFVDFVFLKMFFLILFLVSPQNSPGSVRPPGSAAFENTTQHLSKLAEQGSAECLMELEEDVNTSSLFASSSSSNGSSIGSSIRSSPSDKKSPSPEEDIVKSPVSVESNAKSVRPPPAGEITERKISADTKDKHSRRSPEPVRNNKQKTVFVLLKKFFGR
jgi:hypothetical protein